MSALSNAEHAVQHAWSVVKAEVEKLLGHGEAEVRASAANIAHHLDTVKAAVGKDAPVLEHDAATDVENTVHNAEKAAAPVVAKAEADGVQLAGEAVADVVKDVSA